MKETVRSPVEISFHSEMCLSLLVRRHKLVSEHPDRSLLSQDSSMGPWFQLCLLAKSSSKAAAPTLSRKMPGDVFDGQRMDNFGMSTNVVQDSGQLQQLPYGRDLSFITKVLMPNNCFSNTLCKIPRGGRLRCP